MNMVINSWRELARNARHGIRMWSMGVVMSISVAILLAPSLRVAAADDNDAGGQWWPAYSQKDGGFQLFTSEESGDRLTCGGSAFARYAYWNWFQGPDNGNDYDYWFQRTRLHLKYTSRFWSAFVEPQYVTMFDVPEDAFGAAPLGPYGMGGLYYLHNDDNDPEDLGFHQGWLSVHTPDKKLQFTLGRFEYSDGLEVMDPRDGMHFNTLKNIHLSDRMISSFGWSAFGRSFDGGLFRYNDQHVNVTTMFSYPTQGGWEEDIDETIEDISIGAATFTAKKGSVVPGMELAAFYYNYRDDREVSQRVDNSGQSTAPCVDIAIDMVGGHAVGVYEIGPGEADVLLWGGYQFGDWYEMEQSAYAVAAEAGYQFVNLYAKPWFRVGYYLGSGDDNPNDGDHGTFFQMAPGTRKYNMLPYCDLMNIEDVFAQIITHPMKKLMLRVDYHVLRLNESSDRWYMGSGPTQERGDIFGYIGRPSNGNDALSQEVHALVRYKLSDHWQVDGSYCHIFGDDVVDGVYAEDQDADYASVEIGFVF
jgi:hypothetical protein